MTRITQQQLESYLWGAATRLRGTIDAGDYKQFIFPLLFFKRLSDVYDEEVVQALEDFDGDEEAAMLPENHRFQIPEGAHWSDVRDTSKDMGRAIQKAMRDIEAANPDKLAGIFGDAQWTNKDRLSDAMLRDLVEHFSSLELKIANLPEDELGNGYEYLIKKFADDSGHTAAEFYTNRTVVHLMTEMLQPQPGESIYDPTCGSGGMLLSAVAHLKNQGKEWRNVKLYGQERNLMTSSIARMNCFLHGIEEFDIQRGDTLSDPKFVKGDKLQRFDVVFANPPYSIKQWDRQAFANDKWGRNKYGTPPQGRADYAFWQHIIASMDPKTGRCAILFPHGVLFRQEEEEMRRRLVEADLVECVVGLGPNLFYNSSMEACVVICRANKPEQCKGRILFVDGSNEVVHERVYSMLKEEHIERLAGAYGAFQDVAGMAAVATLPKIAGNGYSLKIDLYVTKDVPSKPDFDRLEAALRNWQHTACNFRAEVGKILGLRFDAVNPEIQNASPEFLSGVSNERVSFGHVVRQVKDSVDPISSGLDRYVAGDHMDSESVHIVRWGKIGEGYLGPAFHRPFRRGQVLYGSRRTYLKKVGLAEFDGITANTTFVIEARPEKLVSSLLPWIMLSEAFTQHSVRESKGSTNPYINFPDIARFSFGLPPLDLQQRLANVLWRIDELKGACLALADGAENAARVLFDSKYSAAIAQRPQEARRLADVLQAIVPGKSPDAAPRPAAPHEAGVLKVSAVSDNAFVEAENKALLSESDFVPELEVRKGMVLVTRSNATTAGVGRACLVRSTRPRLMLCDKTLHLVPDETAIDPKFLLFNLQTRQYRQHVELSAGGTGAKNISQDSIRRAPVWVPTLDDQQKCIQEMDRLALLAEWARSYAAELQHLQQATVDKVAA